VRAAFIGSVALALRETGEPPTAVMGKPALTTGAGVASSGPDVCGHRPANTGIGIGAAQGAGSRGPTTGVDAALVSKDAGGNKPEPQ
jgi:hypothetical protein